MRIARSLLISCSLALALGARPAATQSFAAGPEESSASDGLADSAARPALGRWAGSVDIGSGSEPIAIRVLPAGGLLDFPARGIFGYPLPLFERGPGRLAFSIPGPGSGGEIVFEAALAQAGAGMEGSFRNADGIEGRFTLDFSPLPARGESYAVETGRAPSVGQRSGRLPGTLLLPAGDGNGLAVVLLVAGAGPLDRDGNNYAVPGKCDSLKALAEALADRGVASLRYDKRGAGEAYALVPREEDLVFADYVADAVDALRVLASDGRFSRVAVAGHGEGALVAAAALADFVSGGLAAGREGDFRLALLGASARTALEVVKEELAALPEELKLEAAAIVGSLVEGEIYADPSPPFADFFRPSVQPYLASSFRYDIAAELSRTELPLLIVQGGRDPQAPASELGRLLAARPDARAAVLPGMGRALKEVGPDDDDAYRAFSDPSMPLAENLADLLASFARGGGGAGEGETGGAGSESGDAATAPRAR